jgi:hypothetical protein
MQEQYRAGNLLGSPEDMIEQLRRYERLNVAHVGVIFLGESPDELRADMETFAERVIPAFAA